MTEYVRMPKAHYEAACNSIRTKTGKTDLITSGAMSAEIDSITGGGGSVEGCVTVTFMNGAEVLFTRPVYIGDDCPDPVEQNRIEAPTKESTAQYTYTYKGWATADGGTADETALQNITEDKVLYVAFTANLVYYTVNFYDGDTLLNTERVAYGQSSTYEYDKSGYNFNGWTPSPTNVTADMDCYGEWEESLEIADDWDTIIAAAADGTYATKYKIGQYKPIDLGAEGVIRMQLVFTAQSLSAYYTNADAIGETSTKAPMTFVAMDLLATRKPMYNTDQSQATSHGWSMSDLRAYLQDTIKPLLPANVAAALKTVKKYATEYNGSFSTQDDLWIPNYKEMFGAPSASNGTGTYATNGANYAGTYYFSDGLRIKQYTNAGDYALTNGSYWLRDTYAGSYGRSVAYCSSTGKYSTANCAYSWLGICIGFCI